MINESLVKPDRVYTVSEITRLVKLEVENAFPVLWVEGEISNCRCYPSGHIYFTLKDEQCQLQAVMWRSNARLLKFDLKDGLKVVCRGKISIYEARGQYQLMADLIEPKGKGALQLAFEQLKEKLRAEGLFDPKHKKPLPLFPKRVGIVTSPRGAAIIDILRTLERRFARLHILIYPAKVQGEGAADEIVEGIDFLGRQPGIDVLIVGRGGGSIEDLWAFNEEKVARAIFRSPIPVISAVGHEVDYTIADFVADIRASTPSVAAEIVIKEEKALVDRIDGLYGRLSQSMLYFLKCRRELVSDLSRHRIFQNFRVALFGLEQRLDELEQRAREVFRRKRMRLAESRAAAALFEERMASIVRRLLQDLTARWDKLSLGLHNLSPLNILKKGYTLCWKDDLRLIRRVEDVEAGQDVTVSFYKGAFTCRVKDIDLVTRLEERLEKEKK
ncbi:MAG: Exodeoxyribonuclease 7 large subunit [Candidatus Aminicenantes bacterium]|nr:Exodeoxyribonuclease 7 large subunit [Candidatus Aminicenantes bacterium]